MAVDPSLALQKAIIAEIKDIATAAGNNVFDTVPPSDPFPRVTYRPGDGVPVDADCYEGTESFPQIDVWSRKPGYPEALSIAADIRERLHDAEDIDLEDHTLELLKVVTMVPQRDPDGLTSRVRIVLRAITQPIDELVSS